MALISGHYDNQKAEPYWRRVLQYSVDGCLQAVMDEYVHVLRDVREGTFQLVDHRVRGHFALRFGDDQSDDGERRRPTLVRDAFNSPFRPFVLATTSVGQEGRVHRYKGHAVRKNVALVFGRAAMAAVAADVVSPDVWTAMFQLAEQGRNGISHLVPYWIFPVEGGASVERHVLRCLSAATAERASRWKPASQPAGSSISLNDLSVSSQKTSARH